jgi:hypothetical protein
VACIFSGSERGEGLGGEVYCGGYLSKQEAERALNLTGAALLRPMAHCKHVHYYMREAHILLCIIMLLLAVDPAICGCTGYLFLLQVSSCDMFLLSEKSGTVFSTLVGMQRPNCNCVRKHGVLASEDAA